MKLIVLFITSYPIFKDEPEDACSHLQQEEDSQEDGVGRQEPGVLPESAHAAGEADDEGDEPGPDEDGGGVQGDVGQ